MENPENSIESVGIHRNPINLWKSTEINQIGGKSREIHEISGNLQKSSKSLGNESNLWRIQRIPLNL